jgi:uncharacterized protein YprB with RNaseH-like and TPR domain
MRVPAKKLRKKDLVWLSENRCKHGHTYLEHYQCYLDEKPEESPFHEHIGYFDIEATNLSADFGYMLCYSILDGESGDILQNSIKPREILEYVFDKRLIQDCIKDMRKFTRLVVYYGHNRQFDLPFVRTRAFIHQIEFPQYLEMYATDLYRVVKSKLRFSRNRLANVCAAGGISAKGHPLIPDVWQRAMAGDQDSLDFIQVHCNEDVESLKKAADRILPFTRLSKASL